MWHITKKPQLLQFAQNLQVDIIKTGSCQKSDHQNKKHPVYMIILNTNYSRWKKTQKIFNIYLISTTCWTCWLGQFLSAGISYKNNLKSQTTMYSRTHPFLIPPIRGICGKFEWLKISMTLRGHKGPPLNLVPRTYFSNACPKCCF